MIDPAVDLENLEITFTAASGEPYRRYDEETDRAYYECLVLTDDAVDLTRLNGGASILKNHDPDRILGTIVKAWIEDGKLVVRARFRKNDPEAVAAFRDIVDGTLKNVSIGYSVTALERRRDGDIEYRDVVRWQVFEVSVAVGVPADPTVGFYRSITNKEGEQMAKRNCDSGDDDQTLEQREGEEPEKETAAAETEETPADSATEGTPEPPQGEGEAAPEAGDGEDGEDAEDREEDAAEAEGEDAEGSAEAETRNRAAAAELRNKATVPGKIKSLNINKGIHIMSETKKYSLHRAVQSLLNHRVDAKLERERSDEMTRAIGTSDSDKSIMLSFREGEFINADGNGAGLVGTDHRGDLFIHMLRTRMGVKNATVLSGLVGNVDIPTQTGTVDVGISALNATAGTTKPTVGSTVLSPKKFSAAVTVGEDLIAQGNPDAIDFVIGELQAQIARKLDLAILTGCVSPAIAGLDGTTGVQTVTIANMASITWADVLKMYGKVADFEVEEGDLAWVTKGSVKAAMMGISKDAGSGRFLVEEGKMNGYDVNVCGGLTGDPLYLGVWKNVVIGQWGGLQIRVDDISGIKEGSVTIVGKLLADIAITNPNGFVKRVASGS